MNAIDDNHNKSDPKTCSPKAVPILFSYSSRELWPEESSEEDMDYVPHKDSDESSVSTEETKQQPKTLQSEDDGFVNERTVAPIKISKNKRKNSKNWSIVGKESTKKKNGKNGIKNNGNEFKTGKRGKKTKEIGFVISQDVESLTRSPKKAKRSSPDKSRNDRRRLEKDVSQVSIDDNDMVSKMRTHWRFQCLLAEVDNDFEQIIPNEILIRIFDIVLNGDKNRTQSLINLSRVCESWRKLVISSPLLWRSLDLETFPDANFPYNDLFRLLDENKLFSHIKALNLNGWSGTNAERVLNTIATECSDKLLDLSLKNCKNISSQFLQTLGLYCPNIQILDISAITYFHLIGPFIPNVHIRRKPKAASHQTNQSPFSLPLFRPYLEKCGQRLLSLNLSENTMPSFHSCISSIMDFCPNLELLDISNVESLSRTSSISVEKLQTSCPKIRILRAANITFTTSTSGSQTEGFLSLEELSIPFKSDFATAIIQNAHTDNVLEQLTKNAENLSLLDIRGARYLSHRALVKVPAWNIKHLSISNCPKLNNDQLEMAFTKWNKSLIDVDISWNTSEESVNSCMKSLCEVGPEESQLRSLQLRGSAVSYESIKSIFKCCPKLESIDMQSCRGLPRGIKREYSGQELVILRDEVLGGKYD